MNDTLRTSRLPRSLVPSVLLLLGSACTVPGGLPGADTGATEDSGSVSVEGTALQHPAWWNRLSTSPPLEGVDTGGARRLELGVGHAPGTDDAGAWTLISPDGALQHTALFGVREGDVLYPTLRVHWPDGSVTQHGSDGWQVDVTPPPEPTSVDDRRLGVEGAVSWGGAPTDAASGFGGFELRVGTGPGEGDVLDWSTVDALDSAVLDLDLIDARWHWVAVRAVDAAGNRSLPAISDGVIACPEDHAFVPADAERGVAAFCVSRFEMRIEGVSDGDQPYDPALGAEARASGTPWAGVGKEEARLECGELGDGHQLVSNRQWQSIAHDIARVSTNWSGGEVGVGAVPTGHTDGVPATALPAGTGDPCEGTANPDCTDPGHPDFGQRRTLHLTSGDVIWDFAGNLWEQVDGSAAGPETYWVGFDDPVFSEGSDAETLRDAFAPSGPWTEAEGMGRMYGGNGNLVRGGSFQPTSAGSAGALGVVDSGIHAAHHKAWNTDSTHGFRCVFTPM